MLVGLYHKRILMITFHRITFVRYVLIVCFDCLKVTHVQGTRIKLRKHDYSWPLRQMIKFFHHVPENSSSEDWFSGIRCHHV